MSHASDVGYTPADGARLLSVMLICAAMSSLFLVGTLSVRLSPLGGLLVFSTTQAVTLGMFPLVDGLTGLYIVAMAFGFGYGGVLPSYPIIIREYVRSGSAGTRTGLVVFFGTIGMAIGSSLGGVSFDLTGSYAPAFYAGVACNAANLVIIVLAAPVASTTRTRLRLTRSASLAADPDYGACLRWSLQCLVRNQDVLHIPAMAGGNGAPRGPVRSMCIEIPSNVAAR